MAMAHVSESSFVLLLPTDLYFLAGVATVILTVVALIFIPAQTVLNLFKPIWLKRRSISHSINALSIASTGLFFVLVIFGMFGAHDPLGNPLSLVIWTIWWIVLPIIQGIFGNIWQFINPWSGLYRLINPKHKKIALPDRLSFWPACASLLLFASFMLADPAPDDPDRLAWIALGYWLWTFFMMLVFGEAWLARCEFYSVLMTLFAKLNPLRHHMGQLGAALLGWRLLFEEQVPVSIGIFALSYLAIGSFDGLNETFTWLGWIGVNPLEFPGRSAIIFETVLGLILTHVALFSVFAICLKAGLRLAGSDLSFTPAFALFALATLPIAFVYHIAHYIVVALVNLQYLALWVSEFLGLGHFYVTTGFLNSIATVEVIFRIQAGAVVIGHVIAILLAHAMALRAFDNHRAALKSQIPMALFMIFYTFLGLWLLATAKGA